MIGIVGAYGAAGAVVCRTLAAQRVAPLRLIGRNQAKLQELAGTLNGSAEVVTADVMDHDSLMAASRGCHVLVNCAAPASQIMEKVARVAFECRAHYVDPGIDPRELEWIQHHKEAIEAEGLLFLFGAGYVPGLSELMMRAIYEVHRGKTTAPCNVTLMIVDRNDWTINGFIDILEHFCHRPPEIGVYRNGTFARRSMLTAWMRRRMPNGSGAELLMPMRWLEIEPFVTGTKPLEASVYMPVDPVLYALGRVFSIFAPSKINVAARLAQALFRFKASHQGTGGILYAEASGRANHRPERWMIEVPPGRHYERTGEVSALAAALVADRTLTKPGIQYLAHAVDPHDFIVRLRVWGVEVVELPAN